MKNHPDKPRRLEQIFQSYPSPIYFITFNTLRRKPLLAHEAVHEKFQQFAAQAAQHGVAFGCYVIMPDHVHCFIRIAYDQKIGTTIRLLKRALSAAIEADSPHWQPGFFDHVLRHSESYAEKWNYVRENPVKAGLAAQADQWPFQGEIEILQY